MAGADPEGSGPGLERGRTSSERSVGNHFLEIEVVEEIFDDSASGIRLEPGQVCV